jgi:hypothetical protein
MVPSINEAQLKEALKSALIEVLEERPDLLRDVLAEAMEDVALARAIQEGEASDPVPRDGVFRVLDSGAITDHLDRVYEEEPGPLDPALRRAQEQSVRESR